MNDKFCILLTANDCGHCQHFRGDGIINSNPSYRINAANAAVPIPIYAPNLLLLKEKAKEQLTNKIKNESVIPNNEF